MIIQMKKHLILAALAIMLVPTALYPKDSPWYVNLNDFNLYVKTGFDISDTKEYPREGDNRWKVLPPAGRGGRHAMPKDLNLPGVPAVGFLSFEKFDIMEFTYSIPFSLEKPPGVEVPGINLASLGDNWEIYINGMLVRAAVDLNDDGSIRVHHSRRDIFFPLNPAILNDGDNLIVIRVICDPSVESNGFHLAYPYYLGSFEKISKSNLPLFKVALLALYLFMGIYHIFLYFLEKKYRYNLFYGLFSTDLLLYLFVRTPLIYYLIADTDIIFKIELISLFGILPAVSAFLQLVQNKPVNKITKVYSLFSLFLAIAVIFTPAKINLDILRIWQVVSLAMMLYIFSHLVVWEFVSTFKRRREKLLSLGTTKKSFILFLETLSKTAIGNLFAGGIILFSTAVFDVLDSLYFQNDMVLTNYGFLVFTLGSAFILANRFAFMNRQTTRLNISLEKQIREVERASEQSKISERKYRSLFENNSDAVFLLSSDLTILDGNKAGMKLLGTDRTDLRKVNLLQSLTSDEKEGGHGDNMFKLKFREVMRTGKAAQLTLRFSGKMGETQAVRVRLELIKTLTGGNQVLFRGAFLQEDSLLDYFIGEKVQYRISNSFPLTEEVSRRITANLSRFMDRGEAEILYIGLREIIINAVEHGNLHISFDDKTKAQAEGRYIEFLMERQQMEEYSSKKVKIEATLTSEKVLYRIADEGPGFDHKAFLNSSISRKNETLGHGRGIIMALQLFDTVTYNDKGNEVTLMKKLT